MKDPSKKWGAASWILVCLAISAGASSQPGIVLRVRTTNGSIERLQIPPGAQDSMSLKDALSVLLSSSDEKPAIKIGSSMVDDDSQTIANLGLKQGSLISLMKKDGGNQKTRKQDTYFASKTQKTRDRWDPFPDLAKDYDTAVRKTKTRRNSQNGMSYGDLANLQSSLHVIEPQQEGTLKRVYMCAKSAHRLHDNGFKKNKKEFECRTALLLGTIQRERVELKPKARTSLSSQTESSQYCDVAKVHALWEPPTQQPTKTLYDADSMPTDFKTYADVQRVLRVAELLGLRPVGWVFTYNDDRHKEEDALPVYATDVKTGALLQIANMKNLGRKDGSRFATFSMDATTGVTEAFQLSDVCVQITAEDLWESPTKPKGAGRFVGTKHAVLVDGKETKELDSVLCLVNTAMLSHDGSFAGPNTNSVKKNGGVTNKVKKAILAALDTNNDGKLLEALCDFNLLLALDKTLSSTDTEELCGLVRKWARGQKRGTEPNERLKMLLRSILGQ